MAAALAGRLGADGPGGARGRLARGERHVHGPARHLLGRGRPGRAGARPRRPHGGAARSGSTALIGSGFMAAAGLTFLALPRPILGLFTTDRAVVRLGLLASWGAAVFQLFDGLAGRRDRGPPRPGDTRTPMIANLAAHWGSACRSATSWPSPAASGRARALARPVDRPDRRRHHPPGRLGAPGPGRPTGDACMMRRALPYRAIGTSKSLGPLLASDDRTRSLSSSGSATRSAWTPSDRARPTKSTSDPPGPAPASPGAVRGRPRTSPQTFRIRYWALLQTTNVTGMR